MIVSTLMAILMGCSASGARDVAGARDGEMTCSEAEDLPLVNQVRAKALARPVACSARLEVLARDHAAYLAANEDVELERGHGELAGRAGYTGATLAERAAVHGFDRADYWLSEGLGGGASMDEALRTQLATVYHRSPLLSPGASHFAYALAVGEGPHIVMNVMTSVDTAGLEPVVYPEDGALGVPVAFSSTGERPDPVPDLHRPGFPISAHFPRLVAEPGEASATVGVRAFALTDAEGASVVARLLTWSSDHELFPSDVFLVPEAPLRPLHDYSVRASLTYGARVFDRQWSFTTGADDF